MSRDKFWMLARSLVSAGYSLQFRARGSSMDPHIKDGTQVLIEATPKHPVRKGDLLLGRTSAGRIVLHRMAGKVKNGRFIQLRGDSGLGFDEFVDSTEILGAAGPASSKSIDFLTARSALFKSWLVSRTRRCLHRIRITP